MKLGPVELPALSVPRLGLAAFRRRIVFHAVFLALGLATLGLALVLLTEEKQRSHQRYAQGFKKTLAEVVAQLRHPAGQLALLNPQRAMATTEQTSAGLAPVVLPYAALDFDDPHKAQQAVEMSGCALRYAGGESICVAVGSNAYAGGFIYLVGALQAPALQPRERGALDLQAVHRARVSLRAQGQTTHWIAPFEQAALERRDSAPGAPLRGRLTGFIETGATLAADARPVRDFRGWLWQDGACVEAAGAAQAAPAAQGSHPAASSVQGSALAASSAPASAPAASSTPASVPAASSAPVATCTRRTLYSIRLPVEVFREALFQGPAPVWPPPGLAQMALRLQLLAPGEGPALFDSAAPGAVPAFSLQDLATSLAPGELLHIDARGATPRRLASLQGAADADEGRYSSWLAGLIRHLPASPARAAGLGTNEAELLQASDSVLTPLGRYDITLVGDLRGIDRSLGATASRLSWFVGAMLAAIALAWLIIEVGLIRRVAVLTKRAAAVSYNMQDPKIDQRIGELDVSDLRGADELGILAGSLSDLLQRAKDGVRREHIRAEQERNQWHAVGHEIMSPLQSLMVLHPDASDTSHRYVQRMQQAVRVLYGTASPAEAIASATLAEGTLDVADFVRHVAANAHFAGIEGVRLDQTGKPLRAQAGPLLVHADEYPLEDAVTHVLRNAQRYRTKGTPITLTLDAGDGASTGSVGGASGAGAAVEGAEVHLHIHNQGQAIDPAQLERIFEYGVSDEAASTASPHRGQGLFVARTYMAKMGGTIAARNVEGGVVFSLGLRRVG